MTARQATSPSSSRGFTLVELLMALLILTVGLLGLLQSIEVAFQHKARNLMREEAVQLAEEQLNDLKVLRYDNVTANYEHPVYRRVAGSDRRFLVRKQCEKRDGADAKKLTVAVEWSFKNISTRHEIYSMKSR